MKITIIIQKCIAGFLLALMILGATPKQFLHQAFANHKDESSNCTHQNKSCLHPSGYNCRFDNLVVGTDYLFEPASPFTGVERLFSRYCAKPAPFRFPAHVSRWENKGPPSIG